MTAAWVFDCHYNIVHVDRAAHQKPQFIVSEENESKENLGYRMGD